MAMTAAEIQARLTKINTAIDAILDGKAASVSAAGQSYAALDLDTLERMRSRYERMLAQVDGVRPTVIRFGKAST